MKIPGTVKETIRDMTENLTPVDIKAVLECKFSDLIKYHHGYGMYLRNHYSLWKDESKLREDLYSICRELGIEEHQDSCSHFLIEQMWCRLILDNVDLATDENIRDANKEIL